MVIEFKTEKWGRVRARVVVEEAEGGISCSLLSATKDGRRWKNIPWAVEEQLNQMARAIYEQQLVALEAAN